MEHIRAAAAGDISRIAELTVINYRVNFYPFFLDDAFYFGTLNVMDTASEYAKDSEILRRCYVYDDGAVKGFIRLNGTEIEKLYVEPQFQSQGIGAALVQFALSRFSSDHLWVLEYNQRGIAFYRRNGFELTGEKMLEDGWIPLLKMVRTAQPDVSLRRVAQNDPVKELLDRINEEAFPEWERVSLDDLFASGDDGDFSLLCIEYAGKPAGFFAVRRFEQLFYIAFFAIEQSLRKCGIGSAALSELRRFCPGCQIVTELEAPSADAPSEDIRLRRKRFYLRNGFYETDWRSFYSGTEFEIVCSSPEFDHEAFDRLFQYLHTVAPDFKPLLYRRSDRK